MIEHSNFFLQKLFVMGANHLEVSLRVGGEEMAILILDSSGICTGHFNRSGTMCFTLIIALNDPTLSVLVTFRRQLMLHSGTEHLDQVGSLGEP